MGKNIFEIQEDLQNLIDAIEENGGEVSDEVIEKLQIKQEELENKIDSYCQIITKYKSDDTCCKEEKVRINNIQKTKKNVIEKFKNILLNAVINFGKDGKNGNKIIETATHKLYTINKESFDVNKPRLDTLYNEFIDYMASIYNQGILVTGDDMNLGGVLGAINANLKMKAKLANEGFSISPVEGGQGEEFVEYNTEDLKSVAVNITFSTNLYDLFSKHGKIGVAYFDYAQIRDATYDINSDYINILKQSTFNSIEKCTIGTPIKNCSLTIK